jgi:hypothetical protein
MSNAPDASTILQRAVNAATAKATANPAQSTPGTGGGEIVHVISAEQMARGAIASATAEEARDARNAAAEQRSTPLNQGLPDIVALCPRLTGEASRGHVTALAALLEHLRGAPCEWVGEDAGHLYLFNAILVADAARASMPFKHDPVRLAELLRAELAREATSAHRHLVVNPHIIESTNELCVYYKAVSAAA